VTTPLLTTLGASIAVGAPLNMATSRVINMGAPIAGSDAATRTYVLDQVGAGHRD
jgi:hypothetical protein